MKDPEGRLVGCTFLRNNLNKRSLTVDLKNPAGRDLILRLAPHFDVFAENFRAGAVNRLGLGYEDMAAVHPGCIYVSVSGFGNTVETPYKTWPAYAAVAEAMSGIYEFKRQEDEPPTVGPVGGLGDIGTALFAHHRHPGRPAPPRPDRRGPVPRRGHARLHDRHDRHRDQLLVDGPAQR